MDWVILTYAVIFGVIGIYLVTLWRRTRQVQRQIGGSGADRSI